MLGIKHTKIIIKLSICVFGQIHFPNSLVVAKKWIDRSAPMNFRNQARTSQRQSATLGTAPYHDSGRIDFWLVHYNASELDRIKKYAPEGQFAWIRVG